MSHLPIEIIIHIFELSYFGDDRLPDRKTLRSCSMVCSIWRDPAQQLLFRSICLDRMKNSLSFLTNIFETPVRGRLLGNYVRCIAISIQASICYKSPGYCPEEFIQILSFFPKLYELSLTFFGSDHGLDRDIVDVLDHTSKKSSFPRHIRSLKFISYTGTSPLGQLLLFWPTIQFLSVSGSPCWPPPPEPHRSKVLQLDLTHFPNPEFLRWLAPDHSLKMATIGYSFNLREAKAFLDRQGKSLRSLNIAMSMDVARLMELCPNLEDLKISSVHEQIMYGGITDIFADLLPKTLEHVQFNTEHLFPLKLCYSIIHALPRLRIVTLPRKMKKWTGSRRVALKNFELECEQRNVVLEYAPYSVDDSVMVERFPRRQSVSNFKYMN